MKRFAAAWIMVFLALILMGCAAKQNTYLSADYSCETWQRCLASNPHRWERGADRWFFTADPNTTEEFNRKAPATSAVSTMSVAVPEFSTIRIDGGFQTQIYGTYGHNTVDVYGPNAGVSSLSVDVLNNDVYIHAHPNAAPEITKVIVRIGIRQLNNLVQMGCGPIEGIQLNTTKDISVTSTPTASGPIYLSGHIRLRRVRQAGSSMINIFGVDSRKLNIETCGQCGGVNLAGNVGVRSISHHGLNDINIIGANSPSLCIFANGAGQVGIKGFVRLKKVETHDYVQVYVSQTCSKLIYSDAFDCSRIGLAGSVCNLYTNTFNATRFQGRSLCAQNAYAESRDTSHINITASNRAFATARDDSTIYFFGPSYLLSSFLKGNGQVIPLEGPNWCTRASEFRPYDYTDSHRQLPQFCGAG